MSQSIDIARMHSLIESFTELRSVRRARRLERMASLLLAFREFSRSHAGQEISTFNVFGLLRVNRDEVKHSSFLAWLLDAGETHGQGPIFMAAFARACQIDASLDLLSPYRVRREFAGLESIVDVMVYRRSDFLMYIENKIDAEEGPHQLDRELRDMCRIGSRLRVPLERQFAVFLTPDGRRPVSGDPAHWHSVSYQEVEASFEAVMPQIVSDKTRYVLEDWLDTISTFGGYNATFL